MCRELSPFGPTCGIHGTCINGTLCSCTDRGWTKSSEFAFYLDDENDTTSLWCDTNESLLFGFYLVCGLITIVALFIYANIVNKLSDLKRLSPLYMEGILVITCSFIRVADIDRKFGQDAPFTILVSLSMLFAHFVGQGFYIELIFYINKKYPILQAETKVRLRRIGQVYMFLIADGVLVCSLGIALPFLKTQEEKLITFKLLVFFEWIHFFISVFNCNYAIQFYINHIQSILASEVLSPEFCDDDLLLNLRRQLPKLATARNSVFFCNLPWVFLVLPTFFWDYTFTLWKYYIPLLHATWILSAMFVVTQQTRYRVNRNKRFARIVSFTDLLY